MSDLFRMLKFSRSSWKVCSVPLSGRLIPNQTINVQETVTTNDLTSSFPVAENNHPITTKLRHKVSQKTIRKEVLLDLWRSSCCANNAPGQPPTSDKRCSVFSGIRQTLRLAFDLSMAYTTNVSRLSARYTTPNGIGIHAK